MVVWARLADKNVMSVLKLRYLPSPHPSGIVSTPKFSATSGKIPNIRLYLLVWLRQKNCPCGLQDHWNRLKADNLEWHPLAFPFSMCPGSNNTAIECGLVPLSHLPLHTPGLFRMLYIMLGELWWGSESVKSAFCQCGHLLHFQLSGLCPVT